MAAQHGAEVTVVERTGYGGAYALRLRTFAVHPSLSGSITEASPRLMRHDDLD